MVLTTAFAGPRGTAKPAPGGHRNKPLANIAQKIQSKPTLAARIKPLMPPGMTMEDASAGFADEAHFITALHVARNLDVPFAELKIEVTSSEGDALARAVRALKPTENHGVAVTLAERQTRHDLNLAEQPELPPDTDAKTNPSFSAVGAPSIGR